jgi:hypothetical protein
MQQFIWALADRRLPACETRNRQVTPTAEIDAVNRETRTRSD